MYRWRTRSFQIHSIQFSGTWNNFPETPSLAFLCLQIFFPEYFPRSCGMIPASFGGSEYKWHKWRITKQTTVWSCWHSENHLASTNISSSRRRGSVISLTRISRLNRWRQGCGQRRPHWICWRVLRSRRNRTYGNWQRFDQAGTWRRTSPPPFRCRSRRFTRRWSTTLVSRSDRFQARSARFPSYGSGRRWWIQRRRWSIVTFHLIFKRTQLTMSNILTMIQWSRIINTSLKNLNKKQCKYHWSWDQVEHLKTYSFLDWGNQFHYPGWIWPEYHRGRLPMIPSFGLFCPIQEVVHVDRFLYRVFVSAVRESEVWSDQHLLSIFNQDKLDHEDQSKLRERLNISELSTILNGLLDDILNLINKNELVPEESRGPLSSTTSEPSLDVSSNLNPLWDDRCEGEQLNINIS